MEVLRCCLIDIDEKESKISRILPINNAMQDKKHLFFTFSNYKNVLKALVVTMQREKNRCHQTSVNKATFLFHLVSVIVNYKLYLVLLKMVS